MIRLIEIEKNGSTRELVQMFAEARDVCEQMVALYSRIGYQPPWIGYFAVEEDACIGTCAFNSMPMNGRVEISYYTFPRYERHGHATQMARMLIEIARATQPEVLVTAHTLPETCASTTILQKLGFRYACGTDDPDHGHVWEWHLQTEPGPAER